MNLGTSTNSLKADWLRGSAINGSEGDDIITGTAGADVLNGDAGNDLFDGGAGIDAINGGAGIDTVSYFGQTSGVIATLSATTQADTLINIENIDGTAYADTLTGDAQSNQLAGYDGADVLRGMDGADILLGQVGVDTLYGGNGEDILSGGDNDDRLYGENGADVLSGDAGNDYLEGGAGYDNLAGGIGDDRLLGQAGEDIIDGGSGNDTLWGGSEDDALFGGEGNDTLYGEAGDDLLTNSAGSDFLDGGAGNDTYRITRTNSTTMIAKEQAVNDLRDTVELLDNIAVDDLWFTRDVSTNDLRIRVLGQTAESSQTQILLKGWFDTDSGIERIDTVGSRLNRVQVQTLVDAMAAQAVPVSASAVSTALQTTIHNTWVSKDTLPTDPISDIELRTGGPFSINENAALGTVVGKVDALSASHAGATYQYSLVGAAQNQFVIDATTGIITTARDIFDVETAAQQTITVRVVNAADSSVSYEQSLVVGIGNVNERPVIDDGIFALSEYNASPDGDTAWNIHSNTKNDTVVGKLNASDPENGTLTYQIVSGNKGGAFAINANGQLVVNDARFLDFETKPTWDLGVRVVDAQGMASEVSNIRINLLDAQKESQLVASVGGFGLSDQGAQIFYLAPEYSLGSYILVENSWSNYITRQELLYNGVAVPGFYFEGGLYGIEARDFLWDISGDGYTAVRRTNHIQNAQTTYGSWTQSLYSWSGSIISLDGGPIWYTNDYYDIFYSPLALAPLNIGPKANDDHLSGITNTSLVITKSQILANDYDVDAASADTLIIHSVAGTSSKGGSVSFNYSAQQITYTPVAGTSGDDVISYIIRDAEGLTSTATITVSLTSIVNSGTSSSDNFSGTANADTYAGLGGADLLLGNDGNDTLIGGDGDDMLLGGNGNDRLDGGNGNDLLDGGVGADALIGGAGNDTYTVDNVGDAITENADEGIDTVNSSIIYTLGANIENLTLTGTATNATGNALNNILTGNSASNWLDGKGGIDTLIGGAGDDFYIVDNSNDVIIETAGADIDSVLSSVDYTLSNDVDDLYLSLSTFGFDSTAKVATGNGKDNYLWGNAQANTLSGLGGNDVLDGLAGADTLIGGAGNDTYYIDNAGDVITENANEGIDTVNSAIAYTLGANLENLTLTGTATNATGNALNNTLTGNSASNWLDGKGGIDTLIGGAGDDFYIVDNSNDIIIETAGSGIDSVLSSVDYTLSNEVDDLYLSLSTFGFDSTAKVATGNGKDNYLWGNAQANTLSGLGGNDVLDGLAGADTLIGGAGNDTYYTDNAGDVIIENANEGIDTISSAIAYTLGANLENLTLTGTATNATGNALNNILTGNSASNWLDGKGGIDTLIGGAGDDFYIVDNSSDVIIETAGADIDSVLSSVDYTLSNEVDDLYLSLSTFGFDSMAKVATGNGKDNYLWGNAQANTLSGLGGNDVLDGLAGADTLIGGSGNDTYYIDNTGDVISENASEGVDTVNSAITLTLATNFENLTLTGTTAINGTGNSVANVLTGNSANNTLTGAAGSDTYVFGRGSAADTIVDTDSTSGNTDVLSFLSGIATNQVWFRHVGNNLEVSIIGTADKVTINNWYSGNANHVEQFKTAGKTLLDSNVENLVSAMASFAPPTAGQTTLPQNYQNSLNSVIAANWS